MITPVSDYYLVEGLSLRSIFGRSDISQVLLFESQPSETESKEDEVEQAHSTAVEDPDVEELEERYIKNAAVLPELQPFPPKSPIDPVNEAFWATAMVEPLKVHKQSVEEHQQTYHATVDPLLFSAKCQPCSYSLELGRRIKQNLWDELCCPQLPESVGHKEMIQVTETFMIPGQKIYAPQIEVDISGEPTVMANITSVVTDDLDSPKCCI